MSYKEEFYDDGRVKFRGTVDDWFKVCYHKGMVIYRRDMDRTMFEWKDTRIYYDNGFPAIGYNNLSKVLDKVLPKLKKDYPEEYEYWKSKSTFNYYIENNRAYEKDYLLEVLTIYTPIKGDDKK